MAPAPRMIREHIWWFGAWRVSLAYLRDWPLYFWRLFVVSPSPWWSFFQCWPHDIYRPQTDTMVRGFWCGPLQGLKLDTERQL